MKKILSTSVFFLLVTSLCFADIIPTQCLIGTPGPTGATGATGPIGPTGPSGGATIVVAARLAMAAMGGTLSAVTFDLVDFGASHLVGGAPPYTGFICPVNGCFEFRLSGWRCGAGSTGEIQVTSTRGGVTIVYDQRWFATAVDCSSFHDHWFVPNCQAGDVITFQMNENNAGAVVTSITDPTSQQQGNFQAIYWPQFP